MHTSTPNPQLPKWSDPHTLRVEPTVRLQFDRQVRHKACLNRWDAEFQNT
jgi:hypothetical protein